MDFTTIHNSAQMAHIAARLSGFNHGFGGVHEKTDKSVALGACIFGGGFSFGMEEAGFHVAGHLELPDLALGSSVSRQRWPVHVAQFDEWMRFAEQIKASGRTPDVVYANPPCVAYAGPGKHDGSGDERMCYLRYCSYGLAMELEPKVWVWELVPGIFGKERGFLEAMAFRARQSGYRCTSFLTNSAIHGGYQARLRYHFIASKVELDFEGTYAAEPKEWRGYKTLGDALNVVDAARTTLDEPLPNDQNLYKGAFQTIMPYCPPGEHLRDVAESIMKERYRPRGVAWTGTGVPGFAHTRGRMDQPSPNILGGHTVIHPVEDRYLTPRECATVMGFPIDYEFSPGTKAYAEIGKGLCVHNARFVGKVIHDGLKRDKPATPADGPSFMDVVDWRGRGDRLSLKLPLEKRRQWFVDKHGFVPQDLQDKRRLAPVEDEA